MKKIIVALLLALAIASIPVTIAGATEESQPGPRSMELDE
jgi:hypothetical protein